MMRVRIKDVVSLVPEIFTNLNFQIRHWHRLNSFSLSSMKSTVFLSTRYCYMRDPIKARDHMLSATLVGVAHNY